MHRGSGWKQVRQIKINRRNSVGDVWDVDAVSRTDKRIVLQPVKQRNKETFTNYCIKFFDSKSLIYSDC